MNIAALAAVPLLPALLLTQPSGNYSVTPNSGNPETGHFTAETNPSNYNTQAWTECSNGVFLYGGWKTGTGQQSNTASCSASGDGNAVEVGFGYRQSAPIYILCWTVGQGEARNGSC